MPLIEVLLTAACLLSHVSSLQHFTLTELDSYDWKYLNMADVEVLLMDKLGHPGESRLDPLLEVVHTNNSIADDPFNKFVAAAPILSMVQKALTEDIRDTFNTTTKSKYLLEYNTNIWSRLKKIIEIGLEKRTKNIHITLQNIYSDTAKQFAEDTKPILKNILANCSDCDAFVASTISKITRNSSKNASIRKVLGYPVVKQQLTKYCVENESGVDWSVHKVINVLLPFINEAMTMEGSKEINKHKSIEAENYISIILKNELSSLIENVAVFAMTMDETIASTHHSTCMEIERKYQLLIRRSLTVLFEAKRFKESKAYFVGNAVSKQTIDVLSSRNFLRFMKSLNMTLSLAEVKQDYETKLSKLMGIERSQIHFNDKRSLHLLMYELFISIANYTREIYRVYAEMDQSFSVKNASSLLQFTKEIFTTKYNKVDIKTLEQITRQPDIESLTDLASGFPEYWKKFNLLFSELESHVTKNYGFPSEMFIFSRPFFDLIENILEWLREKTYDIPDNSVIREEL